MLMICGRQGTRPNAGFDLKAVRTGIGAALRTLHSDVLREAVPDRIAELLRQLDQQEDTVGGLVKGLTPAAKGLMRRVAPKAL
jgi:Anti-sigma factor NepR